MKTICIAGKNNIACSIMEFCKTYFKNDSEVRIIGCLTRGDDGTNGWQRSYKAFCEQNKVELHTLKEIYPIENLYFFSTEFDRIVVPERFSDAKLYNIHFSLLPLYRGCFPSVLPILHNRKESGVTLHIMRAGIDDGEILAQNRFEIDDSMNALDWYNELCKHGAKLVTQYIPRILEGDYTVTPQDEEKATYYPKDALDYSTLTLDVTKTAQEVRNQIRAFSFRPYQMLSWSDYKLMDCKITKNVSAQEPGTILAKEDAFLTVCTKDYDVILYTDVLEELMEAIRTGQNETAKRLCACNRILNDREKKHGWTPLIVAIYNNNIDMVKFLLEKGADPFVTNYNGTTTLMYAKDNYLRTKDPTLLYLLKEKGPSKEQKDFFGKALYDYVAKEELPSDF